MPVKIVRFSFGEVACSSKDMITVMFQLFPLAECKAPLHSWLVECVALKSAGVYLAKSLAWSRFSSKTGQGRGLQNKTFFFTMTSKSTTRASIWQQVVQSNRPQMKVMHEYSISKWNVQQKVPSIWAVQTLVGFVSLPEANCIVPEDDD